MTRRTFCAALSLVGCSRSPEIAMSADTFFTVGRWGGHWFFIDPSGEPLFSIGLNHIDSATLRFPASGDVWQSRFGNSERRFIEEGVRRDLVDWGFNCVG